MFPFHMAIIVGKINDDMKRISGRLNVQEGSEF